MGHEYSSVLWNKQKKRYDLIMAGAIMVLIASFVILHFVLNPLITPETLIIRTSSLVAILLLHFILIIGPLCRINPLFLPLLYNRRHLGVTMFFFCAIHAIFSIVQFHALGDINPIASIFLSNTKYAAINDFPFQILGFFAFVIFFIMAATSHDFWLKNLSPKVWKSLHMMVYVAYALVVLHVALGILQYENKPIYWTLLVMGVIGVSGLHLWAGFKDFQWRRNQKHSLVEGGFVNVGSLDQITDSRGKAFVINDENIAVFKYEGRLSAVSNVCRHQQGPLAEGKVIDGCITCPWHGYQYLPHNGQSPPPFDEKLETYHLQVVDEQLWVNPEPKAPGSHIEPLSI